MFVYVRDSKPRRKVAVPVPDSLTWDQFLATVRSFLLCVCFPLSRRAPDPLSRGGARRGARPTGASLTKISVPPGLLRPSQPQHNKSPAHRSRPSSRSAASRTSTCQGSVAVGGFFGWGRAPVRPVGCARDAPTKGARTPPSPSPPTAHPFFPKITTFPNPQKNNRAASACGAWTSCRTSTSCASSTAGQRAAAAEPEEQEEEERQQD